MNPVKKYHIYCGDTKTHYVREWGSRVSLNTDEPLIVLLGDNLKPLLSELSNHNVEIHTLDTSEYKKAKQKIRLASYKLIGRYDTSTTEPENYPALYIDGETVYETPGLESPFTQYRFDQLFETCQQYDSEYREFVLLPKSKWSKGRNLANIYPFVIDTLKAAAVVCKEELVFLKTLAAIDKDIGYMYYYKLHEAGHTNELTDLHLRYRDAKKHERLYTNADALGIVIEPNKTLEKKITKILAKYDAVLNNDTIKLFKLIDRS
jgi:hypothetical protein